MLKQNIQKDLPFEAPVTITGTCMLFRSTLETLTRVGVRRRRF